jgi:hypothetical protein
MSSSYARWPITSGREEDRRVRERWHEESEKGDKEYYRYMESPHRTDRVIDRIIKDGEELVRNGSRPDGLTRWLMNQRYSGPIQNATHVTPSNMYARVILQIEDPSKMCRLLQTLDEEETLKQNEERKAVDSKRPFFQRRNSIQFGAVAGAGGACVSMEIVGAFGKALPVVGAFGAVFGLATGIAGGLLAHKFCQVDVEKKLGIHEQRIARLEGKVQKIVAEKAVEGKSSEEIGQLTRVEEAFQNSVTRYRRVHLT